MAKTRRNPAWHEWKLEDVIKDNFSSAHNNPVKRVEVLNALRSSDKPIRQHLHGKFHRKGVCGPYPERCACCIMWRPAVFRAVQRRQLRAQLRQQTQQIVKEELNNV